MFSLLFFWVCSSEIIGFNGGCGVGLQGDTSSSSSDPCTRVVWVLLVVGSVPRIERLNFFFRRGSVVLADVGISISPKP